MSGRTRALEFDPEAVTPISAALTLAPTRLRMLSFGPFPIVRMHLQLNSGRYSSASSTCQQSPSSLHTISAEAPAAPSVNAPIAITIAFADFSSFFSAKPSLTSTLNAFAKKWFPIADAITYGLLRGHNQIFHAHCAASAAAFLDTDLHRYPLDHSRHMGDHAHLAALSLKAFQRVDGNVERIAVGLPKPSSMNSVSTNDCRL